MLLPEYLSALALRALLCAFQRLVGVFVDRLGVERRLVGRIIFGHGIRA
jgi:hypothetical protein